MASGPHPTRRLSLRFNHSNGDIDIINLMQHNDEPTKYGGLVGGPTRRVYVWRYPIGMDAILFLFTLRV
ncbi:hypothetical protein Pmar_PMAR000686 [Perkinsus marinus ATCC 50983]|uniref:Uncharacterized protein n=1 Tax=Perkinsus marinus (strain ATCC 50983 / TXsc) TaxID=423536 RepID=C5KRH8_PERM5|nr:hypothetical protein Pmar_PMAR000686 [Perkinsus marinus ATCC 50983]EER12951.1 hypothetical protein Pmar_PMAR000686 [Perkinsus marinus ATCC 50983]|eukprot:XP_002781156.1 hypothetical protein Pmar_PMAR000686 [Perkinsus marinus ATCC 50983]